MYLNSRFWKHGDQGEVWHTVCGLQLTSQINCCVISLVTGITFAPVPNIQLKDFFRGLLVSVCIRVCHESLRFRQLN